MNETSGEARITVGSEAVDEAIFREAIAYFATGVTVITTLHEGRPAGMTASAVASLSLDPVLLLVCIDNRLPTHSAIDSQAAAVAPLVPPESLPRRPVVTVPRVVTDSQGAAVLPDSQQVSVFYDRLAAEAGG